MSYDYDNETRPAPPARPTGKPVARQGIMVFASSSNMLYANGDAHYFLKRLNQEGYTTDGALPVIITDLFDKMRKVLESRPVDSEPCALKTSRLILGQDHPVLLQMFGLPDRLEPHRSRVVIKMEQLPRALETGPPEVVVPVPS